MNDNTALAQQMVAAASAATRVVQPPSGASAGMTRVTQLVLSHNRNLNAVLCHINRNSAGQPQREALGLGLGALH